MSVRRCIPPGAQTYPLVTSSPVHLLKPSSCTTLGAQLIFNLAHLRCHIIINARSKYCSFDKDRNGHIAVEAPHSRLDMPSILENHIDCITLI